MGTGDRRIEEREAASQRAATNMLTRIGVSAEKLDRHIIETPDDTHYISQICFKVRFDDVGDILGIIKADGPDGKTIAFHNGDSIAAVLSGLASRLDNGTLKWREDKPYGS